MRNWINILVLAACFVVDAEPIFVSLGCSCHVGIQLRNNNLRHSAYPFDWLLTLDYAKFIELLDNDFEDFLEPRYLVHHWHYPPVRILNTRYNIDFSHDWLEPHQLEQHLSAIQSKYLRRIERFRNLAKEKNKVFFVRSALDFALGPPYPPLINMECRTIHCSQAEVVRDALARKFPDLNFHLVVINFVNEVPVISGADRILEFRVANATDDLGFKRVFEFLIRNYNEGIL